jgi:hypothetical protein
LEAFGAGVFGNDDRLRLRMEVFVKQPVHGFEERGLVLVPRNNDFAVLQFYSAYFIRLEPNPSRRRMRKVDLGTETANDLRQLLCRARETYKAFEETQKEIQKRCEELAGPANPGEIAVICKDEDRIEVVEPADYVNEDNRNRWY